MCAYATKGSDLLIIQIFDSPKLFQSTLPPRGVTLWEPSKMGYEFNFNPHSHQGEWRWGWQAISAWRNDFNPHSHQGEWLVRHLNFLYSKTISIHTPTKGSDEAVGDQPSNLAISIHTPTKGSDYVFFKLSPLDKDFNPHSHQGEWLYYFRNYLYHYQFQSTLPPRGVTKYKIDVIAKLKISIHTPTKGSDDVESVENGGGSDFNPHSHQGEWPSLYLLRLSIYLISIHTPTKGSDPIGANLSKKSW